MVDKLRLGKYLQILINIVFIIVLPLTFYWMWNKLTPEEWTAAGTVALALATSLLYFSAMLQVFLIKKEAKKNRTLNICNRYDNDPIFDQAIDIIFNAKLSGTLKNNPAQHKKAIVTILNYLDSVAIGIEQGLYINALAKDHLNEILQKHVSEYLHDEAFAKAVGYDIGQFLRLRNLSEKWRHGPTNYRE